MKFIRYIADLLRITFRPAFEKADFIATIVGIIGGAITYFYPNTNQYIDIGLWLMPLLVFSAIFLTRFALAPYWLYQQEYKKRLDLELTLHTLQKPLPKVQYSLFRVAQLYYPSPVTPTSYPRYEILQAWFENAPEFPNDQSIAKDVTVNIEFWTLPRDKILFQIHGQWAESTAPDHVGYSGVKSSIDILPSHIKSKLMIALKYKDDDAAYPFSIESLRDFPDGRNPNYILLPGSYFLKISLRGVGINKDFPFILENPGQGESLNLRISTSK